MTRENCSVLFSGCYSLQKPSHMAVMLGHVPDPLASRKIRSSETKLGRAYMVQRVRILQIH